MNDKRLRKTVVLFTCVHCCFPILIFLFWLARSLVTDERQTKIKIVRKLLWTHVNNTTVFRSLFCSSQNKRLIKYPRYIGHSEVLETQPSGLYIQKNLMDFIKLLIFTDKNQKLVVLFVDVHRCFPVLEFLFWLARS